MKINILILIFATLTILYSCSSKQEEYQISSQNNAVSTELAEIPAIRKSENANLTYEEDLQSDNEKTENLSNESTVKNKKIIKDGDISIKTNDIYASKKGIDNLLKKLNAYYESEKLQNDDQTISYYLKIRVPSDNFEKLIISIENGKDEILSKSIQAKDVTEEYIDIESRLTNKREYLKRYKELLSKALTVKDIIAIEENIRILQEEIESKEGRLNYLNDQVLFSTLDINLYKEKEFVYKPQPQDKFSERVKKSLSNGWKSVVEFVLWTITIWPYIILLLIAFFVIKRIIKKRKSKQSL
jgi:Holliday junction resolvase RusA-like endonuclease